MDLKSRVVCFKITSVKHHLQRHTKTSAVCLARIKHQQQNSLYQFCCDLDTLKISLKLSFKSLYGILKETVDRFYPKT